MKTIKIPMSKLQPGMKIKTSKDNKITFKEVIDVWNTNVDDDAQCRLEFTNGTVLNCSVNHPIMVLADEEIIEKKPTELTEFDQIITENDLTYLFKRTVGQSNHSTYIDITVDETNTFFASAAVESEMVLTHNSQGGIRKGSATCHFPFWTFEIEDLLVLKNNKGIDENRVRNMDYSVQFNKLMYERLIKGEDITLFSPNDVPGLYDAFFNDQDLFKELYETAERSTKIRKKKISAIELFTSFMQERKDTGRIYLMNVDHCNTHSSFKEDIAPVYMSNLCQEITLPTIPLNGINDETGRIALCTLSAINFGAFKNPEDMEKACTLAVRGLDALLSYQNYPVIAAQKHTEEFRPLGIGINNLAYFLAKHDVKYSDDSALELVDTWAQHWSYYLIKASADLAKDFGPSICNNKTKYSGGILPIDTYKKEVDKLVKHKDKVDWQGLRKQLKETGIRNSTLMALMPSETSSQLINATNGVEPPRSYVSIKQSKDGVLTQVVPEFRRLKNKYELLWDQKSPQGYLKIMAVLQKYIDQSISVNTSYNPQHYVDDQIPMSVLLKDMLTAYKLGIKTLYYFNTYDGQGEIDVSNLDEECSSCKI